MIEEICEMYFTKQMKPIEISRVLNIPKYKVTRVLQKDEKYIEENQRRKEENKAKHIEETKEYIKEKRKLNNMSYKNWNVSAYDFNKKIKK